MQQVRQILPKLDLFKHKGQNGRLGVVGGCHEYTGAPFYSALSQLRGGGDLSHIFCTKSAATPIKSYSPEIIVHPFLFSEEDITYDMKQNMNKDELEKLRKNNQEETVNNMKSWQQALHAFVIGPGIGRDDNITNYVPEIIEIIKNNQIIVLDADGLWFLSHGKTQDKMQKIVQEKSDNIILTPNLVEFERLWEVYMPDTEQTVTREQRQKLIETRNYLDNDQEPIQEISIDDDLVKDTVKLAKKLNNINIIQKGVIDVITNGKKAFIVTQGGSSKRCGGLGDILAGLSGLYGYWGQKSEVDSGIVMGCAMASFITRLSSQYAYDKYKFGLTAPHVLEFIHSSFNDYYFKNEKGHESKIQQTMKEEQQKNQKK